MASFFRNKLYSDIPTTEVIVLTTNAGTRSTVIGLSLSNKSDTLATANIRLQDTHASAISVTNTVGSATLTGIDDLSAGNISVGDFITGTNVPPGARVLSKTNTGVDQNTIVMTVVSSGSAVTSATFFSSSYYIKDVIVAPNQSLRVINGGEKLILATNMTMFVNSNSADSLDLVMSYVDIV
jgi:hypothetical protein